eukprot:SAG31_NODE_7733_length_1606_cov_2.759788_3_plen_58_part_01
MHLAKFILRSPYPIRLATLRPFVEGAASSAASAVALAQHAAGRERSAISALGRWSAAP